jgi:hypothetical protein
MLKARKLQRAVFAAAVIMSAAAGHAAFASGGLDTATGQTTIPFSINGTQYMYLSNGSGGTPNGLVSAGEIIGQIPGTGTNYGQFRAVGGTTGVMFRNDGSNFYLLSTAAGSPYGTWNGNRPLTYDFVNNNVYIEGLTALGGGNVGIGTTNPGQKLDVNGNEFLRGGTLYMNDAGGGATQLYTQNWYGCFAVNNSNNFGNTASIMYACSSGVTFYEGVTATAYYHSSDIRLKQDIRPVSNGLDIIEKLQGVSFNWKKDGTPSAGIVAQNVEKVMPSAVRTDDRGFKTVEYDQLMAPMIEAIKTQQKEIIELRQEVQALKQRATP